MHELLMKVTRMRLKGDYFAEVFVLWSMGNELVPSPLMCVGVLIFLQKKASVHHPPCSHCPVPKTRKTGR